MLQQRVHLRHVLRIAREIGGGDGYVRPYALSGALTVEEWRDGAYVTVCVMDLYWDNLDRDRLIGGDPRICDEAVDRR